MDSPLKIIIKKKGTDGLPKQNEANLKVIAYITQEQEQ